MAVIAASDDGIWQHMTTPGQSGWCLIPWISDIGNAPSYRSYFGVRACTDGEPYFTPAIARWESMYGEPSERTASDEALDEATWRWKQRPHVPFVSITDLTCLDSNESNWNILSIVLNADYVEDDGPQWFDGRWWVCRDEFIIPVWAAVPIGEDLAEAWRAELIAQFETYPNDLLQRVGEYYGNCHGYIERMDEIEAAELEQLMWHLTTEKMPSFTDGITSQKETFDAVWQYAIDRYAAGWKAIFDHEEKEGGAECCSRFSAERSPYYVSNGSLRCHPRNGPQPRIS